MANTATANAGILSTVAAKEQRPFLWLDATANVAPLSAEVRRGLVLLNELVADHVPWLARTLVERSLAGERERRRARREAPPISVINRRRRAARAWITAILTGRVDAATLANVAGAWLPLLAGGALTERELIEFVRGAFTALVLGEPAENLVPYARALHALESVLARQLGAFTKTHAARAKNRP